ncbi:hypothetical protein AK830_g1577 [Neonectria ditissima]|uniref:Uncharacterized protein n=1 Tax=Neonectria ditissima TaxID=78410 RepID=A0A0P7B5H5_9HYPO|nr:hypothetical protein AK830_g1577 [Neonectria ditissima]
MQLAFSNLFSKDGQGTRPEQTFKLRIYYEESDTTTTAECRAVSSINSVKENCRIDQWWRHIIDFTNPELVHNGNLLTAYPELANRVASGAYDQDPDTKAAMQSLQPARASIAAPTRHRRGLPGSTSVCRTTACGIYSTRALDLSVALGHRLKLNPELDPYHPDCDHEREAEPVQAIAKIAHCGPKSLLGQATDEMVPIALPQPIDVMDAHVDGLAKRHRKPGVLSVQQVCVDCSFEQACQHP